MQLVVLHVEGRFSTLLKIPNLRRVFHLQRRKEIALHLGERRREPQLAIRPFGVPYPNIGERVGNVSPAHRKHSFRNPHQYHRNKADKHMGTDPVVQVVVYGAYLHHMLHIPEYPLDFPELFVPIDNLFGQTVHERGADEKFGCQGRFKFSGFSRFQLSGF